MSLVLDENLLLSAGAGSGKTHTLCTIALGLYAGAGGRPPLDPEQVVVVTFTDRAAAELRRRIAERAQALAAGAADEALAQLPGLPPALGERLGGLVDRLGAAPIGTFHSLCAQLLRRHAAEAGLDPGFAILDGGAASELFATARERALLQALAAPAGGARRLTGHLGGLAAVRAALDLLHAKLAEEGRDPASLVDEADGGSRPAFAVAAAREQLALACPPLARALAGLAGTDQPRLARHAALIAHERERLGTLDPARLDDWFPVVAAVATLSRGPGALPRAAKPSWDELRERWEALTAALAATLQAEAGRELATLLDEVRAAYTAEKAAARGLDFADLIRRARDLLRDDLAVRREVKRRVSALLVDEFQDTNRLQLDLVQLLAEARDEERALAAGASASGLPIARGVLCVVGDRKQSIYEFRGADVTVWSDLATRAQDDDSLRRLALDRSFRARPGLVRFTNALFAAVLGGPLTRPYQVGWRPADALLPVRPEDDTGSPPVLLLERGDTATPPPVAAVRRLAEAERVADWVAGRLAEGAVIEPRGEAPRRLQGGDIALLLRAFSGLEVYRDALARRGIPSLVRGGRGFHGAREVRDAAALLLVLAEPRDRFAAAALLRSPMGGLSDDALLRLAATDRLALAHHGHGDEADLEPADAARLDRLARVVARLAREVDRLGPRRALSLALDELDYPAVLAASPDGEQRLANLAKLIDRAADLAGGGARGAGRAAQRLLLLADQPQDREPAAEVPSPDARAVRILTVHAAKGLEFPVVIVPELGAGELRDHAPVMFDRRLGLAVRPLDPSGERIADAHALQVAEELQERARAERARLFYVAATRAREQLVLCGDTRQKGDASWRGQLDAALPGLGEPLARQVPPPASLAVPPPIAAPATPRAVAEVTAVARPDSSPARLLASVTDLGELARCARRYFYRVVVGLEERGDRRLPIAVDDGDDLDPRARGSLAHLLLERLDFAAAAHDPPAAVRAELLVEGLDAEAPAVAAVAADVIALLRGPLGHTLAATPPGRVFRELPFALELHLQATSLAVRGRFDLLYVDDHGIARLVDYKHARAVAARPDEHAFQLRTYALAARRVLDPAVALTTQLVWLRDRGPLPAPTPWSPEALDEHERQLGELAGRLALVQQRGEYPRLASPRECGDCGYTRRCFGRGAVAGTPPAAAGDA